jgi:signal recognition particle subunit SRP19
LKDYERIVIWLDYFNKTLNRRKGRKIKKELAVFDPTVPDLLDAAIGAGYEPVTQETSENARYPRRSFVKSGYITLPKPPDQKKKAVLVQIAIKLLERSKLRSKTR